MSMTGRTITNSSGFTLVEMVIVITLIAVLGVVAIPNLIDMRDDAKSAVTKDEMLAIKRAITGDSRIVSGGTYAFPGYEADLGKLPTQLTDLVIKPGSASSYDALTRLGWRGPYLDSSSTSDYLTDGWGTAYVFSTLPRRVRSWGPNRADNSGASDDIDLTY